MDSSRGILSGTMDKFKMVCGLSFFTFCPVHLLSFPFLLIHDNVNIDVVGVWCCLPLLGSLIYFSVSLLMILCHLSGI